MQNGRRLQTPVQADARRQVGHVAVRSSNAGTVVELALLALVQRRQRVRQQQRHQHRHHIAQDAVLSDLDAKRLVPARLRLLEHAQLRVQQRALVRLRSQVDRELPGHGGHLCKTQEAAVERHRPRDQFGRLRILQVDFVDMMSECNLN